MASILLIYTGGTIGMRPDPSGVLVPFDFNDIYEEFPSLRRLDVSIDTLSFSPIDSSNVTPELWIALAKLIGEHYDSYDGFVVLHGTDTMSYTASALSFMLEGLSKPVIFTGSQIPIGVMRTDGRENLITSIEIAASKDSNGNPRVPEVSLYFQNKLFRANRTTKYSAEELDAFRSPNYPPLAEVGVNIVYNKPYIMPLKESAIRVCTGVETGVIIIRLFPGITEEIFNSMLSIEGLRGIVLETYGAGNAPTTDWFLRSVAEAISKGIVIINVTQCVSGKVSMDLYETGKELQKVGVISGSDCTTEAALTKLMCLLGSEIGDDKLSESLRCSMRGEMTD